MPLGRFSEIGAGERFRVHTVIPDVKHGLEMSESDSQLMSMLEVEELQSQDRYPLLSCCTCYPTQDGYGLLKEEEAAVTAEAEKIQCTLGFPVNLSFIKGNFIFERPSRMELYDRGRRVGQCTGQQ